MTLHKRSEWTSEPPANANPVVRSLLKGVAIHWNGPAVPAKAYAGDQDAIKAYLRGVWAYHVRTNGWSDIAYNVAVDTNGDAWDLRGLKYQSAANGDEKVNDEYLAILCIVGKGQKPTQAMYDGVRKQVARFRRHYPTKNAIVGHMDIRPGGTDCPGGWLENHVRKGWFRPLPTPTPPPPPPPPPPAPKTIVAVTEEQWKALAKRAGVPVFDLYRANNTLTPVVGGESYLIPE